MAPSTLVGLLRYEMAAVALKSMLGGVFCKSFVRIALVDALPGFVLFAMASKRRLLDWKYRDMSRSALEGCQIWSPLAQQRGIKSRSQRHGVFETVSLGVMMTRTRAWIAHKVVCLAQWRRSRARWSNRACTWPGPTRAWLPAASHGQLGTMRHFQS